MMSAAVDVVQRVPDTNLPAADVPLVVEPELGQGVVPGHGLDQRQDPLAAHVIGLDVEADDGRVLPQHLGDGHSHRVVCVGIGEAEDPHVRVGPQGFGESD